MNTYHVRLYTTGEELPDMTSNNFFHSPELFHIIEKTPGQTPFMAVATDDDNQIVGHLLAVVRRRGSLIPPYLFTQGRVYGEGEYADDAHSEEIFGLLLAAITRKMRRRLCLYTEFSDLSRKMFGYRYFRQNAFVPVSWQEVRNSLHSKAPSDRVTEKMRERIAHVYSLGVETREARTEQEVRQFHRLLRRFVKFKIRHLPPSEELFLELHKSARIRIFITLYKQKIIGGCVCAFSQGNACLWYIASKRKSYPHLHPNMMTIWHAMNWAWEHHYAHFCFLDAGLPYPRNPHREFILSFGGKPLATYRWFRFSGGWFNRLISWFYQ